MSHRVKCSICGKIFDRDQVQAVRTGARRYAHATCDPTNEDLVPLNKPEEDPDLVKLKIYINDKFGESANWAQINRQIKLYTIENNYSLSGILKSLVYFYDIKKNSINKSNGAIGIVPFVYQDAFNYYLNLYLAQHQNEEKDIKTIIKKVREITIPLPKVIEKKRFFNLDDEVADE
jgi:hypothetical protein